MAPIVSAAPAQATPRPGRFSAHVQQSFEPRSEPKRLPARPAQRVAAISFASKGPGRVAARVGRARGSMKAAAARLGCAGIASADRGVEPGSLRTAMACTRVPRWSISTRPISRQADTCGRIAKPRPRGSMRTRAMAERVPCVATPRSAPGRASGREICLECSTRRYDRPTPAGECNGMEGADDERIEESHRRA